MQPTGDTSGYAERLEHCRDYAQAFPLCFPDDRVPAIFSKSVSLWTNGMRTFCYSVNNAIAVKYVSTANLPNLQDEATLLFRDIQLHVEMCRQPNSLGKSPSEYSFSS